MTSKSTTTWTETCDRCGKQKNGSRDEVRDFLKTIYTPRDKPPTDDMGMVVNIFNDHGKETDLCDACYEEFDDLFSKFMKIRNDE